MDKRDTRNTHNLTLSDDHGLMFQQLNNRCDHTHTRAHTHTHTHTSLPEVIDLPYSNESWLSLSSNNSCVCVHMCEAGIIFARCVSTMGAGKEIKVCNGSAGN